MLSSTLSDGTRLLILHKTQMCFQFTPGTVQKEDLNDYVCQTNRLWRSEQLCCSFKSATRTKWAAQPRCWPQLCCWSNMDHLTRRDELSSEFKWTAELSSCEVGRWLGSVWLPISHILASLVSKQIYETQEKTMFGYISGGHPGAGQSLSGWWTDSGTPKNTHTKNNDKNQPSLD